MAHRPSKPSLFALLITFPSAVFPFLPSLTCPYLPSLSSRERPQSTGDKEDAGGGGGGGGQREEGAAARGHERRKETRRSGEETETRGRLIWDDMHTGGHCSQGPVITEAQTAERAPPHPLPSFSAPLLLSSRLRSLKRSSLPLCISEPRPSLID